MEATTFVFLSTTDWDSPNYGSRHAIAKELGRRGHRVLFVEVPRALHSLVSDPEGTSRAIPRMGRIRQVAQGLYAYTPWPVLPLYYHPWTNTFNQQLLENDIRRALRRLHWQVDVLWSYWPNTAALVGRLRERCAVYHCVDDFVAAGYPLVSADTLTAMERRLCEKVDLIIARTEQMAAMKRAWNDNVIFLPGGVDTACFDPARKLPTPSALRPIPRPWVGFLGTLDDRVDVALLSACADATAPAHWILIGPIKGHRASFEALRGKANIHLLPPCPPEEAPAYIAAFDVCTIPYCQNAYTHGLSPIKLYEYLAMSKPVVSTGLPYVLREAEHVRIAADVAQFARAVEQALAQPLDDDQRARWRDVALRYSWGAQVDAIEQALAPLLAARP